MAGRESEKANRYIAALDQARCEDRWDEIPELIRKITKHAPHKRCLLEAAKAESEVAAYLRKHSAAQPSSPSSSNLSDFIPALISTIEEGEGSLQDIFQAQVCLGWIHWILGEPGLTAARLPQDFGATVDGMTDDGLVPSSWTEVCLVKGCYIRGAAQSFVAEMDGALVTIASLIPWLSGHSQTILNSPQFAHWSEKLLAQGALLAGDEACANGSREHVESALKLFRLWSAHPNVTKWISSQGAQSDISTEPASKSVICRSYYDLLTTILHHNLAYVPPTGGSERLGLATELRRVESICEGNVMRQVKFPRANASNSEVEDFIELVIQNWEVLCGPQWRDEELGEGGQTAVGRNLLDMLYRAATKTYHSHLILRRLFHVHSALSEFDLALKALDSYIEIVTSAKERAEKGAESGELESDAMLLQTVSEAVTMLCCFGSKREAERARDLTVLLKKIMRAHTHDNVDGEDAALVSREADISSSEVLPPSTISMVYRAIGVGLANWAYWTPVNESRDDIRADAVEYLEKSLAPDLGDEFNYSSHYTLALLLAEDRDLDGAIDYVKSALTSGNQPATAHGGLVRERDLVPLWHLLALLLSAKQDFTIAERSCDAAFEQFPSALIAPSHHGKASHRQDQYNDASLKHTLIDQLRSREKERIIETRMTQLAFIELQEGPEAAVNHSDQLLSLFATLFHNLELEAEQAKNAKPEHLPPKTAAGTVRSARSFRGSIFGRKSRTVDRKGEPGEDINPTDAVNPGAQWENADIGDAAPAIQVTDEDKRVHPSSDSIRQKLKKRSGSLRGFEIVSGQHAASPNGTGDFPPDVNGSAASDHTSREEQLAEDMVGLAVSESPQFQSAQQPLKPIPHNIGYTTAPPPIGHDKQPPEQDVRLPASHRFESPTKAVTIFPTVQAQKQALGVLVKIWFLIAGLYRRASLFEDAHDACQEAFKHVSRVEHLVGAQESSARAFMERGWGTAKSSEELWADYYAEQGLLSQAQSRPREAVEHFERALGHEPDHPKATIGLANLLLDIWDQKFTAEAPHSGIEFDVSSLSLLSDSQKRKPTSKEGAANRTEKPGRDGVRQPHNPPSASEDEEPKVLNRIAARDRAYGLLSALTKRGSSWDNSEAWYALSRAYEAGSQVEKLKEVLWWCIELEDRRPIRHWSNIGSGVYVL